MVYSLHLEELHPPKRTQLVVVVIWLLILDVTTPGIINYLITHTTYTRNANIARTHTQTCIQTHTQTTNMSHTHTHEPCIHMHAFTCTCMQTHAHAMHMQSPEGIVWNRFGDPVAVLSGLHHEHIPSHVAMDEPHHITSIDVAYGGLLRTP